MFDYIKKISNFTVALQLSVIKCNQFSSVIWACKHRYLKELQIFHLIYLLHVIYIFTISYWFNFYNRNWNCCFTLLFTFKRKARLLFRFIGVKCFSSQQNCKSFAFCRNFHLINALQFGQKINEINAERYWQTYKFGRITPVSGDHYSTFKFVLTVNWRSFVILIQEKNQQICIQSVFVALPIVLRLRGLLYTDIAIINAWKSLSVICVYKYEKFM